MRLNKLCAQEGLLRQISPISFGERFIKAFAVEMAIDLEETAPLCNAAMMDHLINSTKEKRTSSHFSRKGF